MTTPTPNIFIAGAGPVATALAGALRLGGVPVLGLWARRPAQARAAGAISGVATFSAAPPDLLLEADVVILAVRDEAISSVAATLVATGLITTRHVMLHCSGAMSASEALGGVRSRVGGIGTLHPLRAIRDARQVMRSMRGTAFGIEGDERGKRVAAELVTAMGGQSLALDGNRMAAYHAAAAMASNYVVALLDAVASLLSQAGIGGTDALGAVLALAQGALTNVQEHGIDGGLTGPIRRGDVATVRRHLEAIAPLSPQLGTLYRTLGRRTLEIARRLGEAAPQDLDEIAALLAEPPMTSIESRLKRA